MKKIMNPFLAFIMEEARQFRIVKEEERAMDEYCKLCRKAEKETDPKKLSKMDKKAAKIIRKIAYIDK